MVLLLCSGKGIDSAAFAGVLLRVGWVDDTLAFCVFDVARRGNACSDSVLYIPGRHIPKYRYVGIDVYMYVGMYV